MPDITFFCDWSEADIAACQDHSMLRTNFLYRRDLNAQWKLLVPVLKRYPEVIMP